MPAFSAVDIGAGTSPDGRCVEPRPRRALPSPPMRDAMTLCHCDWLGFAPQRLTDDARLATDPAAIARAVCAMPGAVLRLRATSAAGAQRRPDRAAPWITRSSTSARSCDMVDARDAAYVRRRRPALDARCLRTRGEQARRVASGRRSGSMTTTRQRALRWSAQALADGPVSSRRSCVSCWSAAVSSANRWARR